MMGARHLKQKIAKRKDGGRARSRAARMERYAKRHVLKDILHEAVMRRRKEDNSNMCSG